MQHDVSLYNLKTGKTTDVYDNYLANLIVLGRKYGYFADVYKKQNSTICTHYKLDYKSKKIVYVGQ